MINDKAWLVGKWISAFDAMADPVFIQDNDFTIIKVNRAFAKLVKISMKEIIGKKCFKLIRNSDKPWCGCLLKKVKKDNKPHMGKIVTSHTDRALSAVASPIFDSEGKLAGSIHICKDISRYNKITDALYESELRHKALYETSKDAIIILAPGKRFISGNPAAIKLFGCKNEKEFCSKTPADLSPEYQPDGSLSSAKANEMMTRAMKRGLHFFEWKHRKIGGKDFFADVILVKMLLKGKYVLHTTVRDVTDRKLAERALEENRAQLAEQAWRLKKTNEGVRLLYKELEEKNKKLKKLDELKTQFLSAVSHELRTPLTITKEGINLVLDKIPGDTNKKQEEVLVMAKNNIDRLSRIINDLLDISKIEAGKEELKKEVVDLAHIIKDVASFFKPAAFKKGVDIKADTPDKRVDIFADPDKITQVFTNLVGNALKFTQEGCVTISVKSKSDLIECYVSDTGIGVSEEGLLRMFDKFKQLGNSATNTEKGTGLGLSIAKSIVELHDGSIWAEAAPKKGTRVVFVLPKHRKKTKAKTSGVKGS